MTDEEIEFIARKVWSEQHLISHGRLPWGPWTDAEREKWIGIVKSVIALSKAGET